MKFATKFENIFCDITEFVQFILKCNKQVLTLCCLRSIRDLRYHLKINQRHFRSAFETNFMIQCSRLCTASIRSLVPAS
jgi:hypothetical protein